MILHRLRLFALPILLAVWLLLAFFRTASQVSSGTESESPAPTLTVTPASTTQLQKIHPDLLKILKPAPSAVYQTPQRIPVIIQWHSQPIEAVLLRSPQKSANRLGQREMVVSALQEYSLQSSAALNTVLQEAVSRGLATDVQSFWVSPVIAAKIAPDLIASLAERADVVQIRPDEQLWLEKTNYFSTASPGQMPWNLDLIDAELAQQLLGLDGKGVVVANLDTGVDWQHPALLKKYRGYNPRGPAQHTGNWYVVTGEPYLYPGDGIGHGTHTMGTMVGQEDAGQRIGVAPGAKWIAVKLFHNQGYTYESWIHAAFQWILAPAGNPALAPDIVNNSWGSNISSDERFRADVAALLAAGILPVFSAGNNGPAPYTIGSPGSYPESIAVGAVDREGIVATFSSRGPSPWNETKPEISAPGVDIRSAFPGGGYATADGTSMAAPHVAGVAALLSQANPSLTPLEIKEILKDTATPLGAVIPNNATGWGMVNAYAAVLHVVPHGELIGQVIQSGSGKPVPYPVLRAVSFSSPNNPILFSGDSTGNFRAALKPDVYDITISAFGHITQTVHAVSIFNAQQSYLTIQMPALPSGLLTGKVTDRLSGNPIPTVLKVEGTPVQTATDPQSGNYTLSLPEGTWHIRVQSEAHRTAHLTQTVTAGNIYTMNIHLDLAPRLLLVDGGRWYYESHIHYYEDALDALDQPYTLWPIRSLGLAGTPDERPKLSNLLPYDIVIWSDPLASPGWIGMDDIITGYLKSGGSLLLSGQDILYLDGGGSSLSYPTDYMLYNLGLAFDHEGNLSPLRGADGTPFEGLEIFFNTPDSEPHLHPDAAQIRDNLLTSPALIWPQNIPGASTAGTCRPYRAFWQGFGLEGAGPRNRRIELLGRILDWLQQTPASHGLVAKTERNLLIGKPGEILTQTIQLFNTGTLSDVFNLNISGGIWSIDIALPDGNHAQSEATIPIMGCHSATITATVNIPAAALRNDRSDFVLSFSSQAQPEIRSAISLTAKTPAPVLVVDHQIWFHHLLPFTQTLTTLGLPYDIYNTASFNLRIPTTKTLLSYPIILWTTGYNWYDPLGTGGERRLEAYLNQGGRLLLTSQDLLDIYPNTPFIRERLGIQAASLSITPTQVTGEITAPLWENLGPWDLFFPYPNWGDSFQVTSSASVILRDQNYRPVGAVRPSQDWRTAFFSFPLETMSPEANLELYSRLLLWLSPFGESRLEIPPTTLAGTQFPLTLTLGLAQSKVLSGASIKLPLPEGVEIIQNSISGPWSYNSDVNMLNWTGVLQPGHHLQMGVLIKPASDLPEGTILPFRIFFYDSQGLVTATYSPVHINRPWLRLSTQTLPSQVSINDTANFSITLSNAGVLTSTSKMTVTLPVGLELLTETLKTSSGNTRWSSSQIFWEGQLGPKTELSFGFEGQVNLERGGVNLLAPILVSDEFNVRKAWLALLVSDIHYFPIIYNSYSP